jgi:hypothetical protein
VVHITILQGSLVQIQSINEREVQVHSVGLGSSAFSRKRGGNWLQIQSKEIKWEQAHHKKKRMKKGRKCFQRNKIGFK